MDDLDQAALRAETLEGETLKFSTSLYGREFVGLSFKNFFLNLLTLSIYRFWGTTEARKRLWAGIRINGDPLEYTGTGMELFKGFMIALATVGIPYLILVFFAQTSVEGTIALVSLFYLLGPVLIGAAMFLSFRFKASRTTWRGIRFRLKGEAINFAARYVAHLWLSGLTLGWSLPHTQMGLSGATWGKLSYGTKDFGWMVEKPNDLYKSFAAAWFSILLAMLVLIPVIGVPIYLATKAGATTEQALNSMIGTIVFAYLLVLIIAVVGQAWFQTAVLRTIARSVRIDQARLTLNLPTTDFIKIVLVNLLIMVGSLGILGVAVEARMLKEFAMRLKSEGSVDLSEVVQTERGPKSGEGLADAFDLGGL